MANRDSIRMAKLCGVFHILRLAYHRRLLHFYLEIALFTHYGISASQIACNGIAAFDFYTSGVQHTSYNVKVKGIAQKGGHNQ